MGVKVVKRIPPVAHRLLGGIPETMQKAAQYLQSSTDRKIRSGVPPANSPLTAAVKRGSQTLRDSHSMARGIAPHHGATWADASTKAKQARILQYGGTITAKKAKALYIPAGPNTRRLMNKVYGVPTPGALIQAMKADDYTFWKQGKAFMAKQGKKGKPFMLFIIKKSVTIPARPFLYIDDKDEKYLTDLIRNAVRKKLQEKS